MVSIEKNFRAKLKEYTESKLTQKEILFSEETERMQFLADYCCVEQWKLNGLSSDSYFIENAIAINHSKRYVNAQVPFDVYMCLHLQFQSLWKHNEM